jgi:hypothetical protein
MKKKMKPSAVPSPSADVRGAPDLTPQNTTLTAPDVSASPSMEAVSIPQSVSSLPVSDLILTASEAVVAVQSAAMPSVQTMLFSSLQHRLCKMLEETQKFNAIDISTAQQAMFSKALFGSGI